MQFSTLLLVAGAFAANLVTAQQAPAAPTLTFLYSANQTIDTPIVYGTTARGSRIAIPITGGTFTGPRLNGTVLPLGADWGLTDAFGVYNPDTRYGLLTSDGVPIYVQTSGPSRPDGSVHQRIIFEVSRNSSYSWLNEIVAVGVVTVGTGSIDIEAWQLQTPAVDCL